MQRSFIQPGNCAAPAKSLNLPVCLSGLMALTVSAFTRGDIFMSAITMAEAGQLPEDYLSESMTELINVVGYAAAIRMVAKFGGSTLRGTTGSQRGDLLDALEDVLSERAITDFMAWVRNSEIYIPLCTAALRVRRNACFVREFDERLNEGFSGRQTMAMLCPRYGFADRTGWKILKRHRDSHAHN